MERTQPLKNRGAEVTRLCWKGWSFSDLEPLDPCPKHSQANDDSSKLEKQPFAAIALPSPFPTETQLRSWPCLDGIQNCRHLGKRNDQLLLIMPLWVRSWLARWPSDTKRQVPLLKSPDAPGRPLPRRTRDFACYRPA